MVTRKQIEAAKPEATVEMARHWIWTATKMETAADDYAGHLNKPGGQNWEGKTAEGAQSRGADDRKAILNMADDITKLGTDTVNAVAESVMPALKNVRQLIENTEKIGGFTVKDDLSVTYEPPAGTSEERAQQCRDACARFSEQIKDAAHKWWSAEQHVGDLIDRGLAALPDNFNPMAGGMSIPGGLTEYLTLLQANKGRVLSPRENQEIAFRNVFGHAPTTPADWKTAAMLDTHNYDPKYKGVDSDIRVAKIEPHPGNGQVQINAFIPGEKVWNFGKDLGDNRGFDKNASPEHSRVSMLVDYDNGVVIHRQNPSVTDSGKVAAGVPNVYVNELKDGTINLSYNSADGFMPGGLPAAEITAHEVRGNIVIQPGSSGISVGGTISGFPATEIYHGPDALAQYMPSLGYDEMGPVKQLPSTAYIGDQSLLTPFQSTTIAPGHGMVVPPPSPGTKLGPLTDIPTAPVQ